MFRATCVLLTDYAPVVERQAKNSLSGKYLEGRTPAALAIALSLCLPTIAMAEVTIPQEYEKTIKSAEAVGALGNDLFGEQTNFYTGSTTFSATDVQLVGNNALPVAIGRTFTITSRGQDEQNILLRQEGGFADWDLDIPHLSGVFAAGKGWQVDGWDDASRNNRCSLVANAAEPPLVASGPNPGTFAAAEYWSGNSLYIPGMGSEEMLVLDPAVNPHAPADGQTYTWVTNNHWYFSCLPNTANGVLGDAFLAHAPDGTRYFFNWFAKRPASVLSKQYSVPIDAAFAPSSKQKHQRQSGGATPQIVQDPNVVALSREEVWILPTRIEDRFGNYVAYTYDSAHPMRLTSISASDGRSLSLGYNSDGRISSVTAGDRTWTYVYDNGLTQVILPDQSKWTINFSGVRTAKTKQLTSPPDRQCEYPGSSSVQDTFTGTIAHPSGAIGTFAFKSQLHGRSYVPKSCIRPSTDPAVQNDFAWRPKFFDTVGLIQKTIAGPGSATQQWNYVYGPSTPSWEADCPNDSCSSTKTVEALGPGEYKRYTFGTRYGKTEGKLLKVETGTSSSNILHTEDTIYVLDPAGQPYPASVGYSPYSRGDRTAEKLTPVLQRQIVQDGVTFKSQVTQFDGFARPLASTKWSSLGYTRAETTEYEDNLSRWVLGQVKRSTVNGAETGRTTYDPTTAMPLRSYGPCNSSCPGKLQQEVTYYSDGTLATVTDGNSHKTTFWNWKRGVPQNLRYDDSTTQSSVVNDNGWITSITDENNYATGYGYDAMGRLASTVPPEGNPTTQVFQPVLETEYGIGAGHWRQVVTRGAYKKITYFDAFWRPLVEQEEDTANTSGTLRWSAKRYDAEGRLVFASYPRNPFVDGWLNFDDASLKGTRTLYDALGRVTQGEQDSELGVLISKTEYLSGFQRRITNPRGFATTQSFEVYDTPSYDAPVQIDAPGGVKTTIARDSLGQPTAVTRTGPEG